MKLNKIIDFVRKVAMKVCDLYVKNPVAGLVTAGVAAVGALVLLVKKAIDKHKKKVEERTLKDLMFSFFTGKHVTTVSFNSTQEVV